MKQEDCAIPRSTIDKLFGFWLDCIKRQESANIVYLPKSDRYYRVAQFLDEYSKPLSQKYNLKELSIQSLKVESQNFIEKISQMRPHKDTRQVFFVMDGEWTLENNPQIFEEIRILTYRPRPLDTFIITYETDPYTPEFENIVTTNQLFLKNIQRVPLYSDHDILHFISFFARFIRVKLQPSDSQKILAQTGGYIALVSEIMRRYKLTGSLDVQANTFDLKLRSIWNDFSPSSQSVLTALAQNASFDPNLNEIADHLFAHKLLKIDQGQLKISSPLLKKYIANKNQKQIQFNGPSKVMMINGVMLTHFSPRERQLLFTLIAQKQTLTREQAAKILWFKTGEYNDWTLDQIIKRIRDKLSKSGLNPKSLKTIKGTGYRWET